MLDLGRDSSSVTAMVRQQFKNVYFALIRWITLLNYLPAKIRFRTPARPEGFYLHLGSGIDYREGFVNIEGNILQKKDLWWDLRNGLPFSNDSTAFIYSCHVLEHLYPDEALALLKEINRILTPDGVARIAVPSMEFALQIADGDVSCDFPRKFEDPLGQSLNYLFCDGQHKYGYSFDSLRHFCNLAGFSKIKNYSGEFGVKPKEYGDVLVGDEPEGSLIVELN